MPPAAGGVRAALGAGAERPGAAVGVVALLAIAAVCLAPHAEAAADYPMHAGVTPAAVRLGEPMTYHGWVGVPRGAVVRWHPPATGGNFTWGPMRSGRSPLTRGHGLGTVFPGDSAWVEIPLQVFDTGLISIPGLAFDYTGLANGELHEGRLPLVPLVVTPMIAANDSSARLRPERGPLAAPWWERVPWAWVVATLLLVAGVVILALFLRRKKPVAAPVVAAPVRRRDPTAEALAELAALKRLGLPERGRFGEHAYHLGRILRRYFEATLGLTRPGDTTPELIAHLQLAGLSADDVARLTTLLRRWDGIKFARMDSSLDEATRCEDSVRELVMKRAAPPAGKAA